jgi:hypothetical protein
MYLPVGAQNSGMTSQMSCIYASQYKVQVNNDLLKETTSPPKIIINEMRKDCLASAHINPTTTPITIYQQPDPQQQGQ